MATTNNLVDSSTATLRSAAPADILEQVLAALQPPICPSALTKSYDALLDALAKEQDLLWKNEQNNSIPTKDVLRQFDYLRALQIISKLLIGFFKRHHSSHSQHEGGPTTTTTTTLSGTKETMENSSKRKQSLLKQTIQRCRLLTKALEASSFGNMIPPSEYELFNLSDRDFYIHKDENGMYTYDNEEESDSDDDDDGEEIFLSMDRRVLEQEEQELLRMANTPIPGETTDHDASEKDRGGVEKEEETVPLEKEMQQEWTENVYQECQSRKRQRLA